MKNIKTLIFDGSNLLHRCFWVNSVRPTISVEYLFLNSIRKVVTRYDAEDVICTWDNRNTRDVKNFRQVLSEEEYKSTRDKDKAAKVYSHCPVVQELTQLLGVIHLNPDMLEADDYMNWLSKNLESSVIVSADSDMLQCVTSKCVVYNPMKDIEINLTNFEEMTGAESSYKFIRLKAMIGDKSDNIPGIPGIGKKRAKNIIDTNSIDKLPAASKKILEHNIELIDLNVGVTYHENEIKWYKNLYVKQLSKKKLNTNKFKSRCVDLRINNVLKNFSNWISVFDKSKTIESVVEKLIRMNING
jgi:5'-3' exonuclease